MIIHDYINKRLHVSSYKHTLTCIFKIHALKILYKIYSINTYNMATPLHILTPDLYSPNTNLIPPGQILPTSAVR